MGGRGGEEAVIRVFKPPAWDDTIRARREFSGWVPPVGYLPKRLEAKELQLPVRRRVSST